MTPRLARCLLQATPTFRDTGGSIKARVKAPYSCIGVASCVLLASVSLAEPSGGAARPIVLKADHLFDSVSGKLVDHGVRCHPVTRFHRCARAFDCRGQVLTGISISTTTSCASWLNRRSMALTTPRSLSKRASPRCAILGHLPAADMACRQGIAHPAPPRSARGPTERSQARRAWPGS